MTVELVLLALVAAFLGLRLYSVLGKRTGHEQEEPLRRPAESPAPPVAMPIPRDNATLATPSVPPRESAVLPAAEAGLRAVMTADRQFDPVRFLGGAQSAYGVILEAFWKGDREALAQLCNGEVLESFEAAITSREERSEVLDNRLVRIEKAQIADAAYNQPDARITVRFDADIAAMVRDSDGNMIGGSLSDAVETHDIWTFSRNIRSGDPNWMLVETDNA